MIPPPTTLGPDFYGMALLVTAGGTLITAIGTLIAVVIGAIRGGRKLEKIETATNGNASAMVKEIKRLELALVESMEARLAAAVSARLAAEEAAERAEEIAADHALQKKDDAGERAAR